MSDILVGEKRALKIDRYGIGIVTVVKVGAERMTWTAERGRHAIVEPRAILVETVRGGSMVVDAEDLGPALRFGAPTGLPTSAGSTGGDISDEVD